MILDSGLLFLGGHPVYHHLDWRLEWYECVIAVVARLSFLVADDLVL